MSLLIRRAIVGSVVTVAAVAAGVGAANVLQTHANTEVVVTERLVIHREPGRTITVKGKTVRLPGKIRTRTVTRRVNGRTVTQTLVTTLPGRTVTLPRRVVRVPGETRTTTITVPGKTRTRLVVDRRTDTVVRVETTERLATVTAPGVTLPGRETTVEREGPTRTVTNDRTVTNVTTVTGPTQTVTHEETITLTETVTTPPETVTVTVEKPEP